MSFRYILFLLLCQIFLSCTDISDKPINNIIPLPVEINGFEKYSKIVSDLDFVKSDLIKSTYNPSLGEEEYQLTITEKEIDVFSKDIKGYQRAIATLTQIQDQNNGKLPICEIKDKPRFNYRGMHLDVARHFFSVGNIKEYIDYLHYYKFNTFHWHLTEDQGWRIEIKKYPKLQEIAAYRDETLIGHYNDEPHKYDGKKYGGYYTQDEVKEIVDYALNKGIEIIPEIEMPGHSLAALSAYPELGCTGGPYKAATEWGVFEDVYCPTEATFEFLQNVLDEVISLFPSKYIHIGGDECPKESWKNSDFCQELIKLENLKDEHGLQSYFISRIEKYINSKGKSIIGWDEILEGGLAPNATVMSWRGEAGGIAAANQDHNVIMTPNSFCYFDYYQSDRADEPLAIGGYLPVEKVYGWNPIPQDLPSEKHKYILGGQANVWSEYMPTFGNVQYMALNRMIALSEVLWSSNDSLRTFEKFKPRFKQHLKMWKNKGVNIANHLLDVKANVYNEEVRGSFLNFEGDNGVFVSYDGSKYKEIKKEIFVLESKGTYSFYKKTDQDKGKPVVIKFEPHLATTSKITMSNLPSDKYKGSGPRSMVNGVKGSDEKYGDTEWLGFHGKDCNLLIEFDTAVDISHLSFRFFNGPGQWIYLPSIIEIMPDNGKLITLDGFDNGSKVVNVSTSFEAEKVKSLKINIRNYGIIPDGKQGSGHPSWLFVDEITIK